MVEYYKMIYIYYVQEFQDIWSSEKSKKTWFFTLAASHYLY